MNDDPSEGKRMLVFNPTFFIFSCINKLIVPYINQGSFSISLNCKGNFEHPVIRYNLNTNISTWPIFEKPHSYIIHVNFSRLEDVMKNLLKTKSYNSKANFIFTHEESNINFLSIIESFYLVNVVTVNTKNGDLKKYLKGRFEDDGTSFQNNLKFSSLGKLYFYEPTYKVCYFKLAPLQICHPLSSRCKKKGVNIDIVEMVFKSMNLSVDFIERIFSEVNDDDILSNSPCQMNIFRTHSPEHDFTESILQDPWIWVIRSPREKPRWEKYFNIFDKHIWVYWFLAIILISSIWFIVEYILEGEIELAKVLQVIRSVIIFFLDQSRRFSGNYTSNSLLKGIIVVSTFMMNMFYKAEFAYLLTGLEYEQPLTSLQELVDANMKFSFPTVFLKYFSTDSNIRYIEAHHEDCVELYNECYEKVAKRTDLAIISSETKFIYEYIHFLDATKKPLLSRLDDSILTNYFTLILPKGHPLTSYLNRQITRLRENGFMNFIKRHKYKSHFEDNLSNVCMEKLSMNTVKFPFQLWIIGSLLATLIFVKELLNAYLQN